MEDLTFIDEILLSWIDQLELSSRIDSLDSKNEVFEVVPARPNRKLVYRKEISEIRPYILCCIVEGLDFTDSHVVKQFLNLQTQLHKIECHNRTAATIATHDLSHVRFPLQYVAKFPEEITIHPLSHRNGLTAAALVTQLTIEAEQAKKMKKRDRRAGIYQYVHLLEDKPKYACLLDSNNHVISLYPLTNSELTKISSNTNAILVEVTSDRDLLTCKRVMEALLKGLLSLPLLPLNPNSDRKRMIIERVLVEDEEGNAIDSIPLFNSRLKSA